MTRLSLFLFLLVVTCVRGQEQDNLVNTNVERSLDLLSHLPKESVRVTVENRGTKPARAYDYYVEPQHVKEVGYVGATVSSLVKRERRCKPTLVA
jgi:hypothetical protein